MPETDEAPTANEQYIIVYEQDGRKLYDTAYDQGQREAGVRRCVIRHGVFANCRALPAVDLGPHGFDWHSG